MTDVKLLSLVTFLPLLGIIAVAVLPKTQEKTIKVVGLAASILTWAASLLIYFNFTAGNPHMQLVEYISIFSFLGLTYNVGIDGISLYLVLLTTLLIPIVFLAAWHSIHKHVKIFILSVLFLEIAMLGAFVQLNLFFFFIFWEAMLIPMFLLIGIWGSGQRVKSALKFFLYTAIGSLLMLVAIIYLSFLAKEQLGYFTLYWSDLLRLQVTPIEELGLFAAFALAFAIKVPLFPLHTWLPDAHTDAPTPGSVILAGVLLKMGTYGLIRFAIPLFPATATMLAPLFVALGVAGIVFAALVAWVQQDIKKLVAYSSVSHMGLIVAGLFALNSTAGTGAVIQMINHGLSTGALFLLIGMIYDRRHTRDIDKFGGIAAVMPWYATFFLIATLSSIGLPGLNGFIGEFLLLLGIFQANYGSYELVGKLTAFLPSLLAASGMILGALYMLTLVLKTFFGPLRHQENQNLRDLNLREWVVLLPLTLLMIWLGLFPNSVLQRMEPSVKLLYDYRLERHRHTQQNLQNPALHLMMPEPTTQSTQSESASSPSSTTEETMP